MITQDTLIVSSLFNTVPIAIAINPESAHNHKKECNEGSDRQCRQYKDVFGQYITAFMVWAWCRANLRVK